MPSHFIWCQETWQENFKESTARIIPFSIFGGFLCWEKNCKKGRKREEEGEQGEERREGEGKEEREREGEGRKEEEEEGRK